MEFELGSQTQGINNFNRYNYKRPHVPFQFERFMTVLRASPSLNCHCCGGGVRDTEEGFVIQSYYQISGNLSLLHIQMLITKMWYIRFLHREFVWTIIIFRLMITLPFMVHVFNNGVVSH